MPHSTRGALQREIGIAWAGAAELILDGGFRTTDLTRKSYQRVIDNEPYPQQGMI